MTRSTGTRVGYTTGSVDVLRNAEVENPNEKLALFFAEKDIVRLHVPVDDADLVRFAQGPTQLNEDAARFIQPELSVAPDPRFEGLPLD